jgi:DNA-binding GntR family transcriptional regulator
VTLAECRQPVAIGRGPYTSTYDKPFDAIVQHYLAPGTKLTEDSLGDAFGVSRTIIHRALIRLAHDGIVEMIPHRGAFVAQPSVKSTRDVFAVRRTLECAIMAELSNKLDRRAVRRLREIVDAELDAQSRGDWKTPLRLSCDFHLQLALEAGNELQREILKELTSRSSLAVAIYHIWVPPQRPCANSGRPDRRK